MKKPVIKVNEFIIDDDEVRVEGGSISINDKELFEDEIAELIKEMIDALIEARGLAKTHINLFPNSKPANATLLVIEEALKKAGCSE